MKQVVCSFAIAAGVVLGQNVIEEKRVEVIRAAPGAPSSDVLTFRSAPGGPIGGHTFEFIAAEPAMGGRLVKGSPYAAETTVESVQTLADGNRIVNKNTTAFYRDSEGRTRREINVEIAGKPEESHKIVMIDDPVANTHYSLNSREKTAVKMTIPKPGDFAATSVFAGGTPPPPPPPPLPPAGAVRMAAPTAVGIAGGARMVRHDFVGTPQVEELGRQTMEGVEVTGKRTTVTIPAGAMGNERALVMKTETWYSDALQTPILVKRSDPRTGEMTSRTTAIRQTEQPSYLFEVPADYKIEEPKTRMIRSIRKDEEL